MFDRAEELLRRIRIPEDSLIEFKEVTFRGDRVDGPGRKDLADELAAMANGAGGVLVLGVDDKARDVIGIPRPRLALVENYVRDICTDNVDPPLDATIIIMELPDTLGEMRHVIKVEVPHSLFVHKSPHGYFRRLGSSKRELSPAALARLFQQRSQARIIRFDEQDVPHTTAADLDERLWRPLLGTHTEDPIGTLRKMRLLTRDADGSERATVSGVLMMTPRPETWLSGAMIEAVRYRGVHQDTNYQADAARIQGPLPQQILQALAFARRNMTVAATKRPERNEVPQFRVRALFEAIVNAVVHRDYSIHGCKIRMFMFDDRLELYSPGALSNTLTIESLPLRQATRNELLASLLGRCPVGDNAADYGRRFLMEGRGDGVPIILRESEELSGRPPVYRLIDEAELLLTIWSAKLPNQPDD